MDGVAGQPARDVPRVTTEWSDTKTTTDALYAGLGDQLFAAIVVFATPNADLDGLTQGLKARVPDAHVLGCTTAGEIGDGGYIDNSVVAVAFPAENFCVAPVVIENLGDLGAAGLSRLVLEARNDTASARPEFDNEFAMLLVDGLSRKEDQLVNALTPVLGPMPMFGGSAGDALKFKDTHISLDGVSYSNAAVLLLIRTQFSVRIFRFDNFEPTETRMVVTSADAEARVVHEINGEIAAREYARLVGKNPDALSPFIFAANPVVVKVGGQFHVRSIQQVEPNGHLKFFSAIDEGLVLTVAEGQNFAEHLDGALDSLCQVQTPAAIIGCDCVLRRLDAEQSQKASAISRILAKYKVVGFSTYGEQYNGLHVNQTFTGVAVYPAPRCGTQ